MKVLIIVDMQNDFIDGSLGSPEAQAIVPNVIAKIRDSEGEDTLVILTKDTHYEDYLQTQEGQKLPVPHCIYMTPGWSINKEVAAAVDYGHIMTYHSDTIIKSRILKNTFGSITLGNLLKGFAETGDIDSVELVGLCTDICVISNALLVKAFLPEVPITVDASCCAGVTPESHKNALASMKTCQINIINE